MTQAVLFDGAPGPGRGRRRQAQPALDDQDPYISTGDVATYTGYTTQFFRLAIKDGELEAEYVVSPGKKRGRHMIRFSVLVAFLKAIGFKRIPKRPF